MANRNPKPNVPDWVQDELEKAYHRVQNLTAAQRLWDRLFTAAWTPKTGLPVGMASGNRRPVDQWR